MKKSITTVQIVGLLTIILLGSACLGVHIRRGVHNADAYFDRARHEIERIQADDPGRRGGVHEVCILVHDRHSSELVEVTTPLWLADACLDIGLSAAENDLHKDFGEQCEHYGLDLKSLKDLDRLGPGLLVELNDEDSQVLIWLK